MKNAWRIGWLLLGLAGAGSLPAQDLVKEEIKLPDIDLQMGLSSLIALADTHMGGIMNSLRVAAAGADVRSGDWQRMRSQLVQLQKNPVAMVCLFIQPDGAYFNTDRGLTGLNVRDRPYFPALMAGREVIGDLVVSRSTGKKGAILAVPVRADGKVIGAIGATVFLESLSGLLARQISLPDDMVFYALNDKGETALHSSTKWLLEEPAKLRSQTLAAAVREILTKWEGAVSYEFEGEGKIVAFSVSTFSGWHFALGMVRQKIQVN